MKETLHDTDDTGKLGRLVAASIALLTLAGVASGDLINSRWFAGVNGGWEPNEPEAWFPAIVPNNADGNTRRVLVRQAFSPYGRRLMGTRRPWV